MFPFHVGTVLSFKCCLGYCNQYIYAFLHLNRVMPQDTVPLETLGGGSIFRRNNFENNYIKQVHFKPMEIIFLHILSHCRTIYVLKKSFLFKFCVASKSPKSFAQILINETEKKRRSHLRTYFPKVTDQSMAKGCLTRTLTLDSQVLFLDQQQWN